MSGLALAFALGMATVYAFQAATNLFVKRSIGAERGIGNSARKKMLATLEHDALLTLAADTQTELARRRS